MNDEQIPNTEGDEQIPVDPTKDFERVFPAGTYMAEVTSATRYDVPVDAKKKDGTPRQDAGESQVRVRFRLMSDDPEIDGATYSPFPLSRKAGRSFSWQQLLAAAGYPTERGTAAYNISLKDLTGVKCMLKLSVQNVVTQAGTTTANRLERIFKAEGEDIG